MKTLLGLLVLALSVNVLACDDYSGQYILPNSNNKMFNLKSNQTYILEIEQVSCKFQILNFIEERTGRVVDTLNFKTDGTLQRNLSQTEYIYGLHRVDRFEWNHFNQRTGEVMKIVDKLSTTDISRTYETIGTSGQSTRSTQILYRK